MKIGPNIDVHISSLNLSLISDIKIVIHVYFRMEKMMLVEKCMTTNNHGRQDPLLSH